MKPTAITLNSSRQDTTYLLLVGTEILMPAAKTRHYLYQENSAVRHFTVTDLKDGDFIGLHYKNNGAAAVAVSFDVNIDTKEGLQQSVSVGAGETWEFTIVNSPLAMSVTGRKIA